MSRAIWSILATMPCMVPLISSIKSIICVIVLMVFCMSSP